MSVGRGRGETRDRANRALIACVYLGRLVESCLSLLRGVMLSVCLRGVTDLSSHDQPFEGVDAGAGVGAGVDEKAAMIAVIAARTDGLLAAARIAASTASQLTVLGLLVTAVVTVPSVF